jgi:fibronectin-binding autotransporter adhesin
VGVYGATGTLSSGPVVNNGILLIARNNTYKSFSGISGTGTLYQIGDGTTTLSGTNTYTGGTFVNAGRLLVNGTATGVVQLNSGGTLGGTGLISGAVTVNSGGHLAPGASVDSLYVGSLVLNPGSILDFELGAPGSPGINSDLINVTASGGLTISGGSVALTNAGGLAVGTYTLIDYLGTLGGAVANLGTPTGPAGFSYALVNNASNTSIDLTVGLLGDYNHNGIVDSADYVVWRKNPAGFAVDAYATWRSHFGQPSGSGSGAIVNAAVPEPASLGLLLFAAAGCCLRRGRAA